MVASHRARLPTLMLAVAANATTPPAPASLHGTALITDGWPFAHSARDMVAIGPRKRMIPNHPSGTPCTSALCGKKS